MPALHTAEGRVLDTWVGLRLFTMLWATLSSVLRPITPRESEIALWPPTDSFLIWLERVLIAPWQRWDSNYFLAVIERGYRSGDGTLAFHPLLPVLSWPLTLAGLNGFVALWAIASICSAFGTMAVFRLARLDYPEKTSEMACTLLLAFPVSAILFAPYTEPLWILCAALSLHASRQGRWWQAGLWASAATLTRQQGLFLVAPLVCEMWQSGARFDIRRYVPCALPAVTYIGWMGYRLLAFSDLRPDFSGWNAFVYSTLLSSESGKVVPHQAMIAPWNALALGFQNLSSSVLNNVTNLGLAAVFVALTVVAWPRLRASDRILTALIYAASFSYYTGPEKPYMGLPRHLLLAFPVFIGAAPALAGARGHIVLACCVPLFLFVLSAYVLKAWVP
ncbi:MAG TPA: mannosyltransferase family protein [Bryobacteraceae bacterium]|nr:mannosyltransferase family protein [Bryobacteraceae bacterium]